jgi:hypothetical protein
MIQNRFMVVGASTMMQLAGKMNTLAHPLSRLIYFGPNLGDYSDEEIYTDEYRQALFIAVFDIMPVQANIVDEFTFTPGNDSNDEVSTDSHITMSA